MRVESVLGAEDFVADFAVTGVKLLGALLVSVLLLFATAGMRLKRFRRRMESTLEVMVGSSMTAEVDVFFSGVEGFGALTTRV